MTGAVAGLRYRRDVPCPRRNQRLRAVQRQVARNDRVIRRHAALAALWEELHRAPGETVVLDVR
jgi:hypothetical protein